MGIVLDELSDLEDRSGIVLDLRTPRNLMPVIDFYLLNCFQGTPPGPDAFLATCVDHLMSRGDLEGLTLRMDACKPSDSTALHQRGYIVSSIPQTVADLLGSGTMTPTQEFIDNIVGGHDAWQTLQDVLRKGGFEMRTPKRAVPVDYAVFRKLKTQ